MVLKVTFKRFSGWKWLYLSLLKGKCGGNRDDHYFESAELPVPSECVKQSTYNVHKKAGSVFCVMVRKREIMRGWVVMYGCESWTVEKAECWRIAAFEVWCWRRLLRVPWTARRSNRSILRKISPGVSLEGMMLWLKLQYFGQLKQIANSLEKMPGKIKAKGEEGSRGWDD